LLQNLDEFHSKMSKANTLENEQNISEATVFKGFGYNQCARKSEDEIRANPKHTILVATIPFP
jgi:hypothetical protein